MRLHLILTRIPCATRLVGVKNLTITLPEDLSRKAKVFAAAQVSGCHVLYTEEIDNGKSFGGVCVVNPFTETAAGLG